MSTQSLVRSIQECLHAEAVLEERRRKGGDCGCEMARMRQAWLDLEEQLGQDIVEVELKSLVNAAQVYVNAAKQFLLAGCLPGADEAAADQRIASRRLLARQLAALFRQTIPVGRPTGARMLIAIDDTTHSLRAVIAGGRLALLMNARVMLLHVIRPMDDFSPELVFQSVQQNRIDRENGAALLERAAGSLPQILTVERSLREGDAVDEIVAAAREWRADLIVVGTRGRGRLAEFILGSTAEGVIRKSECPVVALNRDANPWHRELSDNTASVNIA